MNHQSQFPAVTLSFNLAPGVALGQATEIVRQATDELQMPVTVSGSFQGTAQQFQASVKGMPLLVAAAILAIYLVLGMLYESLIHPLTILSTLPSAGVGALLAMLVSGYELSLVSFIGIILLMGIVKKNAIMMIDFALDAERRLGLPPGGSDLPRLHDPFPPDHDDDDGRAARLGAAGARPRHRFGTAPTARHRGLRRTGAVANADAVHDTGGLSDD